MKHYCIILKEIFFKKKLIKLDLSKLIKKKIFVWVSDFSKNSGEGNLARLYINKKFSEKKIELFLNQKKQIKQKYLSSIFGIIYCWKKYFKNENVYYVNYLPLWNFLIFMLLPPRTKIGPITGGANFRKEISFQYIVRKFLFPIFYKISEIFLMLRNLEIIFSTDLLKKYLSDKTINKSEFNFVFKNIVKKKKRRKEIEFLIYYRNHSNKKNLFPSNLIKNLSHSGIKIHIFGDKFYAKNVINLGHINNKKVNELLSKTKYTIISSENIYSLFVTECLSNHVKILIDKKSLVKLNHFRKNFLSVDFKKKI